MTGCSTSLLVSVTLVLHVIFVISLFLFNVSVPTVDYNSVSWLLTHSCATQHGNLSVSQMLCFWGDCANHCHLTKFLVWTPGWGLPGPVGGASPGPSYHSPKTCRFITDSDLFMVVRLIVWIWVNVPHLITWSVMVKVRPYEVDIIRTMRRVDVSEVLLLGKTSSFDQ